MLQNIDFIQQRSASKIGEIIRMVADRTKSAATRFIRQMLAIKYAMGLPMIGPSVRKMFDNPDLAPIRALADVIACIELHLQNREGGEIEFGMIIYNRTSAEVADVLSTISDRLVSVVDHLDEILKNVAEHSAHTQAISSDIDAIRTKITEKAWMILGTNSTCLLNITGIDSYYPGMVGGIPKQRIQWHGKERVVRKDKDGNSYIMSKRARVYLATIRSQYRYKKD